MEIRMGTSKDISALRLLYEELQKDCVKYQPEHFVMGYQDDQFFERVIKSENQDFIVAVKDDVVIGFSHVMILKQKRGACLKEETNVYIQDLDVMVCERNAGVGTLLIAASKKYGKAKGANFIRTQVFPQNEAGLRFYHRNGFREMMKTIESSLD